LKGFKKALKDNPKESQEKADAIIKNTYRTLMTRGMKGCYVYFTDKETEEYFKNRIDGKKVVEKSTQPRHVVSPYSGIMINIPLFDSVGCGELMFADPTVQEMIPVKSELMSKGSKYFVLRTSGDSMNLAGINDGDLVLCRKNYHPEEGNNVVALIGDDATIKEYRRENGVVVLKPKSSNPKHKPLRFKDNDEIKVQGVVVCVLEDVN
jgi:repressor LexA